MITLVRPTTETAKRIRTILDGIVKANVKVSGNSVRVVVKGSADDAGEAINQLSQFGFCGPTGKDMHFTGPEGRYTIWVYKRG